MKFLTKEEWEESPSKKDGILKQLKFRDPNKYDSKIPRRTFYKHIAHNRFQKPSKGYLRRCNEFISLLYLLQKLPCNRP